MVQNKFVTIFCVAAAATILPALAAPTLLAAREPQLYERALALDDASLQTREVDDAMFAERSFNDPLDLEERDLNFYDEVQLDAREPLLRWYQRRQAKKQARAKENDRIRDARNQAFDMELNAIRGSPSPGMGSGMGSAMGPVI